MTISARIPARAMYQKHQDAYTCVTRARCVGTRLFYAPCVTLCVPTGVTVALLGHARYTKRHVIQKRRELYKNQIVGACIFDAC